MVSDQGRARVLPSIVQTEEMRFSAWPKASVPSVKPVPLPSLKDRPPLNQPIPQPYQLKPALSVRSLPTVALERLAS